MSLEAVSEIVVAAVVGGATVYVAIRQYQLDKRQAKLEQRRARIEIYAGVQSIFQAVIELLTQVTKDKVPREAVIEFSKIRVRSTLLLDDENMHEYLSQLWAHVLHLRLLQMRADQTGLSEAEQEKIQADINDELAWLAKQEPIAISHFQNYLSR